ncbi:hypothetical protein PoB_006034900 [Plakobranchus ocellatus]|uniref:Uncharacterized protein n=1 Tax=Plakobranchus ocellatus TaxID=259542 RepID=A0AAV4CPP5_9GAST|nr:hypothetical protein PoB_006034900 [Plakobranchus ocellatus]
MRCSDTIVKPGQSLKIKGEKPANSFNSRRCSLVSSSSNCFTVFLLPQPPSSGKNLHPQLLPRRRVLQQSESLPVQRHHQSVSHH